VFNFVKLAELYYAGSHGMDIKGPTAQSKHTKAKVRLRQLPPTRPLHILVSSPCTNSRYCTNTSQENDSCF
jgi:hypothetical protein